LIQATDGGNDLLFDFLALADGTANLQVFILSGFLDASKQGDLL
jgi:hypothetical protein